MAETSAVETIVKILNEHGEGLLCDDGIDPNVATLIAHEILAKIPSTSISSSQSHAVLIQEISTLNLRVMLLEAEIELFESSHEGQDFADRQQFNDGLLSLEERRRLNGDPTVEEEEKRREFDDRGLVADPDEFPDA